MKINMNIPILGLDGKELPDANVGKLIAQTLVNTPKGDALKFFGWAQKLYAGSALELDASDTETLKNFIKESDSITILAKAQALACFKDK
ncbi:MAG: hypothetical protein RLZZ196_1098 [Bacteroidota bacterium]|jgi:hypothetical protein